MSVLNHPFVVISNAIDKVVDCITKRTFLNDSEKNKLETIDIEKLNQLQKLDIATLQALQRITPNDLSLLEDVKLKSLVKEYVLIDCSELSIDDKQLSLKVINQISNTLNYIIKFYDGSVIYSDGKFKDLDEGATYTVVEKVVTEWENDEPTLEFGPSYTSQYVAISTGNKVYPVSLNNAIGDVIWVYDLLYNVNLDELSKYHFDYIITETPAPGLHNPNKVVTLYKFDSFNSTFQSSKDLNPETRLDLSLFVYKTFKGINTGHEYLVIPDPTLDTNSNTIKNDYYLIRK